MSGDRPGAPTVGDLVVATPGAAQLFERLGLDYCCGGDRTLEDACAHHRLDVAEVEGLIDALRADPGPSPDPHDMAGASFREMCEHIVVRHHGPLRVSLTRIAKLAETVARVHGTTQPRLVELVDRFAVLRMELEEHMRVEEGRLFPACGALDGPAGAPVPDEDLLELLRDDHQSVGAALDEIRTLCGGFDERQALCGTHRELLRSLHGFEVDLHQHVHEENNVLFPRVLASIGARP